MMTLTQHPLSAAFPAMQEDEYKSLKESIASIGLQNPITLYEGMVIDGWHRYQGCIDVGCECATVDLGEVDPREFVLAQNKSRRQINKSQLAMAVACVYEWAPNGSNQHKGGCAPGAHPPKTADQMAAIAGVGLRTMVQAKLVESKASPEVIAAVKTGAMSVKKAAESLIPATAATPKDAPPKAHAAPVAPVTPSDAPEYSEMDKAWDMIDELREELEATKNELTAANMASADPQKQKDAADVLADLRKQISTLEATLKAVTESRDTFQHENAVLRRDNKRLGEKLRKLEADAKKSF